ncbi:putative secreted RxLR effector protein [Phytophthora cinnamomi]|uniref:putative secreted RxLR effector protein n=1 Tax=Phytophthora cinnamomi TaxID=4785 RepID=UPI002B2E5AA3|nr:putative secreted RxLR effector protein [Phytophthora cinnamomi]QVE55544.1 RxLR effector protein 34a [Phytophthora cinnamomi]
MRVLLWVLLVALVTLLSSTDALSTNNSDKKQVVQPNSEEVATRMLAANYENNNDKRMLRGESKMTYATNAENDEERAVFIKFQGSVQRLREKFRDINPFSTKNIEKRFQKLADKGRTPDYYFKKYQIGTFNSRHWNRRFYKKYEEWYKRTHPDWVSEITK